MTSTTVVATKTVEYGVDCNYVAKFLNKRVAAEVDSPSTKFCSGREGCSGIGKEWLDVAGATDLLSDLGRE